MKCDRQDFCHFGPAFALLPPNNPKKKILKKLKKTPGDTTILNICTINDNHIMYGFQVSTSKYILAFNQFIGFILKSWLKMELGFRTYGLFLQDFWAKLTQNW